MTSQSLPAGTFAVWLYAPSGVWTDPGFDISFMSTFSSSGLANPAIVTDRGADRPTDRAVPI